jgi:hypothetical protein
MHGRPRARKRGARRVAAPAVEKGAGRERVNAEALARSGVFPKISEDVDEGVSNGTRRCKLATVPAIRPETAFSSHEVVHVAGDANDETAEAGRQSSLVARFDHEVHVIPLHGEMQDAEAFGISARGALDRKTNGRKDVLASERTKR